MDLVVRWKAFAQRRQTGTEVEVPCGPSWNKADFVARVHSVRPYGNKKQQTEECLQYLQQDCPTGTQSDCLAVHADTGKNADCTLYSHVVPTPSITNDTDVCYALLSSFPSCTCNYAYLNWDKSQKGYKCADHDDDKKPWCYVSEKCPTGDISYYSKKVDDFTITDPNATGYPTNVKWRHC